MLTKKKKLFFSFCVLLALILSLCVFEVALGIFCPQPPRGFSERLFINRNGLCYLKAGAEGLQYSREFMVGVAGNKEGYRAGTWPAYKKAGKQIALLGDSFLFGWGVKAEENVTTILNANTEDNYYNLGIPGDGPVEQLARLKEFSAKSSPDIIVLLFYDNDLSSFETSASDSSKQDVNALMRVKTKLLKLNSIRLVGRVINGVGAADFFADLFGYQEARRMVYENVCSIHNKDYFESAKWDKAVKVYHDLFAEVKKSNSRLIIIRITPAFLLNNSERNATIKQLRSPKTAIDFSLLDMHFKALAKDNQFGYYVYNTGIADQYFPHDMHLNSKGHRSLADFISQILYGITKN